MHSTPRGHKRNLQTAHHKLQCSMDEVKGYSDNQINATVRMIWRPKPPEKQNDSVALERSVDVLLAEGSRLSSRGHQLVVSVDALHVCHNTETEVSFNPFGRLHKFDDGFPEGVGLRDRALSTVVEVLASKLGSHDRLAVSVVPELQVRDHSLSGDIVVVNAVVVGRASSVAGFVPVVDPNLAVGVGAGGGCEELVTFVVEGLEVLYPERRSFSGVHVGLTVFVGLVETCSNIGVTLNDKLLEVGHLVATPQHRNGGEAKRVAVGGERRAPCVNVVGVAGDKVREIRRVAVGPSKTDLLSGG